MVRPRLIERSPVRLLPPLHSPGARADPSAGARFPAVRLPRWCLWIGLPLVAYALRTYRLGSLGDLEFDEIVSVWYAGHRLSAMLGALARALFEHPPLYYVALRGWLLITGQGPPPLPLLVTPGNPAGWGSPEALPRWLSVLPGVLLVPLVAVAGRRLGHPRAGWLAGGLVAAAPLHVFYSRETRMYELVTMLATLMLVLMTSAASRGGLGRWVIYTAAAVAALATHYLAATAVLAHGIYLWRRRHGWPAAWRAWLRCAAVAAVALVGWLYGAPGVRESLPALALDNLSPAKGIALLWQAWKEFAAGPQEGLPGGWVASLAALALAALTVAGLLATRKTAPDVAWLLGASAASPLVGISLLIAIDKPFQSRYLLLATPACYLLAAIGAQALWSGAGGWGAAGTQGRRDAGTQRRSERSVGGPASLRPCVPASLRPCVPASLRPCVPAAPCPRVAALTCCGILGIAWLGFASAYYGEYRRADYSALTRRIEAYARPGDGILLAGPWQFWYFRHYYQGTLDHHLLPREAPPPATEREVRARLEDLARHYRRLWVAYAGLAQSDPSHNVERWLLINAWEGERVASRTAVLGLYRLDSAGLTELPGQVTFGDRLEVTAAAESDWVPSGDIARFVLRFRPRAPLDGPYRASLRLVGPDGQEVRRDFAVADGLPGDPPRGWLPNTTLQLRRGLWLPPGLGFGSYRIQLLVYPQGAPEAPLAPDRPDPEVPEAASLGTMLVGPAGRSMPLDPQQGLTPLQRALGDPPWGEYFTVVGYRLDTSQARPGGRLAVILAWLPTRRPDVAHQIVVELRDAGGRVVAQQSGHAVGGTMPTTLWRQGELLQDRRVLGLSSDLGPGEYFLSVRVASESGRALRDPATGADRLELGTVTVRPPRGGARLGWLEGRVPAPLLAGTRRLLAPVIQRWLP